jgi:hypothetical protein
MSPFLGEATSSPMSWTERHLGRLAILAWIALGIGYALGLVQPGDHGPRGW